MARTQMTYYCSCGQKLVGNGAKASHRRAHEKRSELRHQGGNVYAMTRDQWEAVFVEDAGIECRTCIGVGRIRDGETNELRRCLDCNGSGRRIKEAGRG